MTLIYIFLTILMFLDCVILVLLVLLQLPKKEAGAGIAFGSGATDALFGAGSGNVLTKITKYAAGIFFGLALIMAMVASNQHQKSNAEALREELMKGSPAPIKSSGGSPSAPVNPAPAGAPASGLLQLSNLPPATQSTTPNTNK